MPVYLPKNLQHSWLRIISMFVLHIMDRSMPMNNMLQDNMMDQLKDWPT